MQSDKISKLKIVVALEYWHDRLAAEYGEEHILNITLYGSQNYNINTELSDVDVKAIYIPSLREAVLNQNWLSHELHIENEHCELKDIREMCKMYQKQNLNFIETLFTPYRWDNPQYKSINNAFKSKAEDIAHFNANYGIKSTCGQAIHTIKELKNNPTDYKKLAKIIYLYLYLNKYIQGINYQSCLYVNDNETFLNFNARSLLINLKTNNVEFLNSFNDTNNIINFLENFFKTFPINADVETNMDTFNFLQETTYDAILSYEILNNERIQNETLAH